jgi:hypothetical protein
MDIDNLVKKMYRNMFGSGTGTLISANSLGYIVQRNAAVDIAPGPTAIFAITGGHILLTGLWGFVTIIRSAGVGATMALAYSVGPTPLTNPALAITGNATVGTIETITGDPADPLVTVVGAGVNIAPPVQGGMHGSVAGGIQQFGLVLGVGNITVAHSAVGATGSTRYTLSYIPLDVAARVVAA